MSWMNRVLRKLRGIPAPAITRDKALQIALEEMARRGQRLHENYPHFHPRAPKVRETLRTWDVWLDPDFRPCRVVEIDNQTGQIRRYLAPPR